MTTTIAKKLIFGLERLQGTCKIVVVEVRGAWYGIEVDDESGYEEGRVVYRRVAPAWRTQELQDFLWRLDIAKKTSRKSEIDA